MLYFSYNILSLVFFIIICFFIEVMGGVVDLLALELCLSIYYFICLGWAVLKFNKYPLFLLMFIVFGLFIYSRFILDSFGLLPYEINLATRFVGDFFEKYTIKESILIYMVSLIGLSFSFSFVCFFKSKEKVYNC